MPHDAGGGNDKKNGKQKKTPKEPARAVPASPPPLLNLFKLSAAVTAVLAISTGPFFRPLVLARMIAPSATYRTVSHDPLGVWPWQSSTCPAMLMLPVLMRPD